MSGTQLGDNGAIVGGAGSWIHFASIDFGTAGAKLLRLQLASLSKTPGFKIQLHADSVAGPILATLAPAGGKAAARYHSQTARMKKLTGVHDLYLVFTGKTGSVALSWFTFVPQPAKVK